MVHRFLAAFALLFALAACQTGGSLGPIVSGGKHDVAGIYLSLPATSPVSVAVAVVDRRPYVVDGKESPEFLGTERAPWSQTVDIKTQSGRPMADDLAEVVAGALTRAGAGATALPQPRGTTDAEALAALQAQGADRLLVIAMHEWRSDSYTRVVMKWHFEATVFDASGNALGRSRSAGNTPVGGTVAADDSNQMTQRELRRQLANLLGDPAITRALR